MAADGARAEATRWLAYITTLPTDDPAARMSVLRTLESLGCAVLRDGVFPLPDTAAARQGLSSLTEHIRASMARPTCSRQAAWTKHRRSSSSACSTARTNTKN